MLRQKDDIFSILLPIETPWKRRLVFFSLLTAEPEVDGEAPVLVGGNCLEFYTHGQYATGDVDFICGRRDRVDEILQSWGFSKAGKDWFCVQLGLSTEIPANKQLKGCTASVLRREFPELRSKLPTLWTRGWFIASVGSVNLDVVKRYIDDQKGR